MSLRRSSAPLPNRSPGTKPEIPSQQLTQPSSFSSKPTFPIWRCPAASRSLSRIRILHARRISSPNTCIPLEEHGDARATGSIGVHISLCDRLAESRPRGWRRRRRMPSGLSMSACSPGESTIVYLCESEGKMPDRASPETPDCEVWVWPQNNPRMSPVVAWQQRIPDIEKGEV